MDDIKLPPLPAADRPGAYGQVDYWARESTQAYARKSVLDERYIIELLVAAGHVTAEQVEQARGIAATIRDQPLRELNRLSEEMGEQK